MKENGLLLHPKTKMLVERLVGKLPHGLIVDGPSGSGVLAISQMLAKSVGSPVFVLQPKKKVKGDYVVDPREGSIIIEDIRMLYEQTRSRVPGEQVYIVDTGLKSMTIAAQNAFLKLLEEPHEGVHFIIATHQHDQLLPTIISRCQRLPVLPITDNQTSELIESLSIDDTTKKARLAFVGRGLPALIKRLASDEEEYEARVEIMKDAKVLLGKSIYDKLRVIHAYREKRADTLVLVDDMNYQLKTVLKKQPDRKIARTISDNLAVRDKIAAGGNIRLQLAACVL